MLIYIEGKTPDVSIKNMITCDKIYKDTLQCFISFHFIQSHAYVANVSPATLII